MKKRNLYLQLFAEDGADSAGTDNGGTDEGKEGAEGADKKDKKSDADKPKYSDNDVNKMFNQKFAEWQAKKDKEIDEAKKLADMNAQQKAEYERDQLQKQLDEYKKKDSLVEMSKTARKMLADKNITITDDLLSMFVSTDAEQTKKTVDDFAKMFTEAVESAVKERLKGGSPRKAGGGGAASMTKEQILAIKDPEERQKKMLENRELFNF